MSVHSSRILGLFYCFLFRKWDIGQPYRQIWVIQRIERYRKDEKPYCRQNKNLLFDWHFRLPETVN